MPSLRRPKLLPFVGGVIRALFYTVGTLIMSAVLLIAPLTVVPFAVGWPLIIPLELWSLYVIATELIPESVEGMQKGARGMAKGSPVAV